MQISQTAQISHLPSINDLYDIELKVAGSINSHENVNLASHLNCTGPSNCFCN